MFVIGFKEWQLLDIGWFVSFSYNNLDTCIYMKLCYPKDIAAKTEVPRMFETQKSGNKTSSGEIGFNNRTLASPKVGQDQVSGVVSVLCWHTAPVANVLWKPLAIRLKVEFGNNVQISNRVKNGCNAWSMEGVTVDGHHPECHVTFGRGNLVLFDKIPVPTI